MTLQYTWKSHDHANFNFKSPWYALWMSFKGPHNFMVTALDHSVKWPFSPLFIMSPQTKISTIEVLPKQVIWFANEEVKMKDMSHL